MDHCLSDHAARNIQHVAIIQADRIAATVAYLSHRLSIGGSPYRASGMCGKRYLNTLRERRNARSTGEHGACTRHIRREGQRRIISCVPNNPGDRLPVKLRADRSDHRVGVKRENNKVGLLRARALSNLLKLWR